MTDPASVSPAVRPADGSSGQDRSDLAVPALESQRLLSRLRGSLSRQDGFVLQLLERAARLATSPGQSALVGELLELASGSPWLTCQAVRYLAVAAQGLGGQELEFLSEQCLEALELVAEADAADLLEDLARSDCRAFLRAEALLSVRRAPPGLAASRLAGSLRRLPPSGRAQLDLDLLVKACLERMEADQPAVAYDLLLQTVSLRDLQDETLRDRLVGRYTRALSPAQVGPAHRERLYYLSRYALRPEVRARVLALHDLSRLNALSYDLTAPDLVLETLVHFPQVLCALAPDEAEEIIAYVLKRLYRYLSEEDHLRIGATLCPLERPGPFLSAYRAHLETLHARGSEQSRQNLWCAALSAWLSPGGEAYLPVLKPLLQELVGMLERPLRRQVSRQLRQRFGVGLRVLRPEEAGAGLLAWSWLRPRQEAAARAQRRSP